MRGSSVSSREVLAGGPEAVRIAKRIAREPLEAGELAELLADLRASDEAQEGLGAFLERRPPSWRRLTGTVGRWSSTYPKSTRRSARRSATSPSARSRRSPGSSTGRRRFRTRSSAKLGELGWMGIPFPEAYGGAGRRHAGLRRRGRGARARRLVRRDHALRAHLARHAADLPVRDGGAEAGMAPAPDLGRAARGVRADRARGRVGCRQHAHARPARRRRVGDRRRQAVHHQRGHRHLGARHDHRGHGRERRPPGDLEPARRERHARVRGGGAVPEDGLERVGHEAARRSPAAVCRRRTCSGRAAPG